ncbi:unnamed protein product [Mytilus edulis]|uniref:Uncharacterized protein n=1 Tax=Mytilus edulis TaxID=6550 RepID=A0A8S3V645_MYTED|nr:unnamed protein product [Mytilus edulis]
MESDEEAFIEAEIQKGLDKLTEADLESSDNSASDVLNSDNKFDNYVKSLQQQTTALELDLAECDDLLRQSVDITKNKAMVLVTKEQLEFKELLAGQKDRIQEQSKKQEDQLNQKKIEELEEIAKREKEEWEKRVKEEQIKQEEKKEMAAVKIQSVYKGYCKVSNEPWKLKASTSKRPPRRPSSAKKLHMLEESIITTAAKVASLRQNHVLLHDLILEDNNITSLDDLNQSWLPLVQKLNISQNRLHRRHEAAVKIQSAWRGYSVRRWYEQVVQDQSFDMAVLLELHNAAIKIQAIWRGYSVRCRLERALDFAKLEDDDEFGEIDMNDLNFNEFNKPREKKIGNRLQNNQLFIHSNEIVL